MFTVCYWLTALLIGILWGYIDDKFKICERYGRLTYGTVGFLFIIELTYLSLEFWAFLYK